MPATVRSRIVYRPFRCLKTEITIYRTVIVSLLYWDGTWSHVREEHVAVNISRKLILKLGRDGVDWINLAQGRDKWRAVVNTSVNHRVHWNAASQWVAEELVAFQVGLVPLLLVSYPRLSVRECRVFCFAATFCYNNAGPNALWIFAFLTKSRKRPVWRPRPSVLPSVCLWRISCWTAYRLLWRSV